MNGKENGLRSREAMEFDAVSVPSCSAVSRPSLRWPPWAASLDTTCAIRLKQLAAAADKEISVVVIEKGSEVGAHMLSGAVIDPKGLDALIPDWKQKGAPVTTTVTKDRFLSSVQRAV